MVAFCKEMTGSADKLMLFMLTSEFDTVSHKFFMKNLMKYGLCK